MLLIKNEYVGFFLRQNDKMVEKKIIFAITKLTKLLQWKLFFP